LKLPQGLPTELKIATTIGVAETELPEILEEFYKENPDVRLIIQSGNDYLDFTDPSLDVVIGLHLSNRIYPTEVI
jgi:DNA-binding transcriptional LysR family regulator